MINLTIFNNSLFEAGTEFFNQLGIQLNSNTASSLGAKELLKDHYKDKGIFKVIDEAYFLGLVDDSVFDGNTPLLNKEKISLKEAEDRLTAEYNGLMVFAVGLRGSYSPTRGEIADLTRAFNRVSKSVPVVLLLKYGGLLSFAASERTKYKQAWREGEKIGKISLLKDINIDKPHAGHLKILDDLKVSPAVMDFNALYRQWQEVFNVQLLNKKFYQELANWYFWALRNVEFPEDAEKNKDVRNAISVIRMITRLIFIWFVKEKGLITDDLFNEVKVREILVGADGVRPDSVVYTKAGACHAPLQKKHSSYYKAILQNLFFATLNTEMNKDKPGSRKFRGKNKGDGRDQHYMIHNVFRYEDYFTSPQDTLKKYFENIPFLNGGLFECLDKEISPTLAKGGEGGFSNKKTIRIDGFSDRADNPLKVPDYLFFSSEQPVDLNEIYGTKNKTYKVRGLINILDSYKFTVDENTPIEEEIALDPELLGKVFENLLASYNPETQTTARKQTGSFYTPREIVNYMVDESLIAYLTQALSKGEGSNDDKKSTPGWMTTEVGTYVGLKEFVKENRRNQTSAEGLMWERLRNSQLGVKFRRQHPIGKFIADFVCLEKQFIIEIDGEIHNEQKENDEQRDKSLLELGYRTIRFKNDEVNDEIDTVLKKIQDEVKFLPLSPSPLERDGVRLRHLIAYNDDPHKFTSDEVVVLIAAINTLKALDPACGSGAFPMGMLHKLVYILGKLDPDNSKWREVQRQKAIRETEEAYNIGDKEEREKRLLDISEVFENNASDYGRKLYIIENCIFGVDIQPIAVQIAKLRFFVSLIVDQRIDSKKENLGVRPLPNLETKFVAANTLIGIDKPAQLLLRNPEIDKKERELKEVRERHFTARTPQTKEKYRKADERLRTEISELLKKDGFPRETTEKLAKWNPYDQNASADFFNSEWMFGITEGFDVVIGNPPYFNISTISKDLYRYLAEHYKSIHTGYNDIVYYFIYIGIEFLNRNGCCALITSNYYLGNEYARNLRKYLKRHISKIVNFKDHMVFDEASIHTCISLSYKEAKSTEMIFFEAVTDEKITSSDIEAQLRSFAINRTDLNDDWLIADKSASSIIGKLNKDSILLGDISTIEKGSTSGRNNVFTISCELAREKKFERELLRKNVKNGDIERYAIRNRGNYLIYVDNHTEIKNYPKIYSYLESYKDALKNRNEVANGLYPWYRLERPRNKAVFDAREKIVVPYRAENNRFAYDDAQYFNDGGDIRAIVINDGKVNIRYVLALLNSELIDWFYGFIGKPKGKVREYFNKPLSLIPIKKISSTDQHSFIVLVDQILAAKKKDPNTDTSALERQIDQMVYKLYGLTDEEIRIVEGEKN